MEKSAQIRKMILADNSFPDVPERPKAGATAAAPVSRLFSLCNMVFFMISLFRQSRSVHIDISLFEDDRLSFVAHDEVDKRLRFFAEFALLIDDVEGTF